MVKAKVAEGDEETGVVSEAGEDVEGVLEAEEGVEEGDEEEAEVGVGVGVGVVVKKEGMMGKCHRAATSLQKQTEDASVFAFIQNLFSFINGKTRLYICQFCNK